MLFPYRVGISCRSRGKWSTLAKLGHVHDCDADDDLRKHQKCDAQSFHCGYTSDAQRCDGQIWVAWWLDQKNCDGQSRGNSGQCDERLNVTPSGESLARKILIDDRQIATSDAHRCDAGRDDWCGQSRSQNHEFRCDGKTRSLLPLALKENWFKGTGWLYSFLGSFIHMERIPASKADEVTSLHKMKTRR